MKIVIDCELEVLANDLSDVLRLFYGHPDIEINGAQPDSGTDMAVRYRCVEKETSRTHSFCVSGTCFSEEESFDPSWDRTRSMRLLRRHAKMAFYRYLKERTGYRPPWGGLTGIRPTLLYRMLIDEMGEEPVDRYMREVLDVSDEKMDLLLRTIREQQGIYEKGNDRDVDIYIGIPFCRTRCIYCSFISSDLSRTKPDLDGYVRALSYEMECGGRLIRDLGKRIRSVYVGGGTPTAIGRERLEKVLGKGMETFGGGCEWTVEAGRPDTIDPEMLRMIYENGVRRISINPQTMCDETLRLIGRDHSAEDIDRAVNEASRFDWQSVNMDLIAGLPGETADHMRRTLDRISQYPVQNITVHTLALKRSSRIHEFPELYPLPTADEVSEMIAMASRTVRRMGMNPYYMYRQKFMNGNHENVGYCLPGTACVYNIDIMEETHSILAFGAGGSSKRVMAAEGRHERAFNSKGVDHYIANIEENIRRKNRLFEDND